MPKDLDTVAAAQLGLITYAQLLNVGFTARQVRRRADACGLIRVRKGVYRLSGAPQSWNQAVLAAALAAGKGAVISHATAARLWDLRHSERYPARIHISGPRQYRLNGVASHQVHLTDDERTVTLGIPVTTAERTIIDVAGALSGEKLGQCVDDAIRRHLISLEQLRKDVAAMPSRGGCRKLEALHQVLADRIPGYRPDDSDFETDMNRVWDELGLPPAHRQYRVAVDGHNYRIDRAIVVCRIGIEWDSYRFHSSPSDRDHDSNRRARLAAAGWLIIPVTANAKPELIAQAVLRAYHDRGGAAVALRAGSSGAADEDSGDAV